MNTKNLIEAAKFQASIKPQDEFLVEVAERLGIMYEQNNNQQAEIERLQSMNNAKLDTIHDLQIEIEKLKNEAEEYPHRVLTGKGLILTKSLTDYDELIADISNSAVKEFAERLKQEVTLFRR